MEIPEGLPEYQYRKKVKALKIAKVGSHPDPSAGISGKIILYPENKKYAPIEVALTWAINHTAHDGGYFLVYDDGYQSFSPADVFEYGYSEITDVPDEEEE